MAIYEYDGRKPQIHETAYIFPNATLIGDVKIGRDTWIGPGAVLRGDYGSIEIGAFSAIEDNCVLHARPGEKTLVGDHVTVGHGAVIHTATVRNWAVLGMHSVISDFAVIGEWAAVAEGAVVKNNGTISDRKVAVGIPAKEVTEVSDRYMEIWTGYKSKYNEFCRKYREGLVEK